ncbi:MAG TPA: glycosyltransferase family 2 protein [Rhizomicrobium sp.]|jgi:glycosyltransferase|nr:glycosyltransferase family 2 protein [Rhizomicrobium sp.]
MQISVVMVCLNAERTIGFAIDSFLRQTHKDKELLILDGGSTDRTIEIASNAAGPGVQFVSEPDDGLFDAMNKGLRAFRGEAVGFLNSDDAFHDEFALARIADGLAEADVVYGDLVIVRDHLGKKPIRVWKSSQRRRGAFRWGWTPAHPTFYVRRHVAQAVGEFDTRLKFASDYDFMLRVVELHDFRLRYIPHTQIDFGYGGHSTKSASAVLRGNLECLASRRRHLGALPVDLALVLKLGRKLLQLRA